MKRAEAPYTLCLLFIHCLNLV